jgi:hypothetical protein
MAPAVPTTVRSAYCSRRLVTIHPDPLWTAVDGVLARADVEGILAHKLGPLAARRLRSLGEPVPAALESEERLAKLATVSAGPLLRRIRDSADGPLLLIKGPEVASLYPDKARSFVDVDLLAVDSLRVHDSLRRAGFVEVDDPALFVEHHHLRPLQLPGLWLKVEIHHQPMLPRGAGARPAGELVEAASPSVLGIEGIDAPHPVHHALMLAAHAWVHEPLGTLRDLVDVGVVAGRADAGELEAAARVWGIERIWRTTARAVAGVLGDGPTTAPLTLFGRHLGRVRERTVLDNHLQRWLHPFWELPFGQALLASGGALRQELLPEPGEGWRSKATRVRHAVLHPGRSMSSHTSSWRGEVEETH